MSGMCNKCGQGEPHLGDTWCLGCSALEALSGELRQAWGQAGTRVLACDLLASSVRHVRALRRLGIAGAGRVRASSPVGAAPERAPTVVPPRVPTPPRVEPAEAAPPAPVESVKKEAEEESSEYTDAEESGDEQPAEEKDDKETATHSGLKAAPKSAPRPREESARPDHREDLPRRRPEDRRASDNRSSGHQGSERGSGRREADTYRAPSRDRPRRRSRPRRDKYEEHHYRGDRRAHYETGEKKGKKRKKRHNHRGGSKHQKHYKAAEDPFRRFHYKPPDQFWDRPPSPP